jgi:diaminopimelate decarboxylase
MIIPDNILQSFPHFCQGEFEPFYIYDSQLIRGNCKMFREIPWENKSIHFATMANSNVDFLKIVKEEKINVFVNSLTHLQAVQQIGFQGKEIIFTSSATTYSTMEKIRETGAQMNADSPNQLHRWMEMFPDTRIGIRCNIGETVEPLSTRAGYFIGKASRLGFTVDELNEIQNKAFIKGLHLYAGTDIFDIPYLVSCYRSLIQLSNNFPEIEYLNFGGGFGVSENGEQKFDIKEYGRKVADLMEETSTSQGKSIQLILEPGRIIGGSAGYFVCVVTDIKKRKDQCFVGINGSIAQFPRPLMYPDLAHHPILILRDNKLLMDDNLQQTTIYGSSTYSRDLFCSDRLLPQLRTGDIIVFGNAGSYCASSYCEFLGFPKPNEYFV